MSALADFPLADAARHPVGRSARCTGVRRPASASRSVVSLLNQANRELLDAEWEPDSGHRFVAAYTAGLRAAAAMLALRGRPHRGRAKPTSAWVLLERVDPELAEWAEFFANASSTNAAIQSGITRVVTPKAADEFVRRAGQFVALVERAVAAGVC